jgi:hypothetical protein
MTSTDLGMAIAHNPHHEKESFSMRDNLEFSSNVTDIRELQDEKHDSQMNSTDAGIAIESN